MYRQWDWIADLEATFDDVGAFGKLLKKRRIARQGFTAIRLKSGAGREVPASDGRNGYEYQTLRLRIRLQSVC